MPDQLNHVLLAGKKKKKKVTLSACTSYKTFHLSTCQSCLREDLAVMKTFASDPQNHVLQYWCENVSVQTTCVLILVM